MTGIKWVVVLFSFSILVHFTLFKNNSIHRLDFSWKTKQIRKTIPAIPRYQTPISLGFFRYVFKLFYAIMYLWLKKDFTNYLHTFLFYRKEQIFRIPRKISGHRRMAIYNRILCASEVKKCMLTSSKVMVGSSIFLIEQRQSQHLIFYLNYIMCSTFHIHLLFQICIISLKVFFTKLIL